MEESIRTMAEVLDKAAEVAENKELVEFDRELVAMFELDSLLGTVQQLTTVLQALRTSAMAVTTGFVDKLDELDMQEELKDDNKHFDA